MTHKAFLGDKNANYASDYGKSSAFSDKTDIYESVKGNRRNLSDKTAILVSANSNRNLFSYKGADSVPEPPLSVLSKNESNNKKMA